MNDRSHIHATKTPAVPRGQAELDIQGMSCASCVRRIENSLAKIHGVDDAKVNFASRTASVTYDTETTNVPDMLAAIESLGYTAQSAQIDTGEHHPSNAAGHHHANESLRDLTLRLSIAALLTLPLMVLAMSHGYIPFLNFPGHQWLQFVLATPVVFWCGWEFFRKAWAALKHKTSDMNTLIAMGAGSAYLFSAAVTIFPRFARFINPNPGHEAHAAPPVYFEAAAAIVTLILLGRYLEETARRRGK